MTEPDTDPVRAFRAALPPYLRAHLNTTQRVTALIHRATREHHWTTDQLAAECTRDTIGVYRPGGLITSRLERCSEHPPAEHHAPRALPFCASECADNAGWILDENGHPIRRCSCRTPTTTGSSHA